jgi:hypothetical protein
MKRSTQWGKCRTAVTFILKTVMSSRASYYPSLGMLKMCELCGCRTYLDSGKQSVMRRAHEIIRLLSLTPENVELFEDCERISHAVASYSFPSFEGGDILETCRWVHRLHEPLYRDRILRYLAAAKDVFDKVPVKGDIRAAITDYHQLEQLVDEIGDEELASITDENVRQTLEAVRVVHDNNLAKKTSLKEKYGLE